MEKNDLAKILDAAVRAPSGENCQPWRFRFEKDALYLFNIPERDRSLYNFRQYGSLVSHGAVIENISIAASSLGYATAIQTFPVSSDPDCTARIEFFRAPSAPKDALYESIPLRASNRTKYDPNHLLDPETEKFISTQASSIGGERLILVKEKEGKARLARAMSYGDKLLFKNRHIHHFLFDHIHWTIDDALKAQSGFYFKELGLTREQMAIFKILRHEPVRRLLSAIGFASLAAAGNASVYAESSAIGAVISPESTPKNFIDAGRFMERVWLAATATGYDVQLLTAVPFFAQRARENETEGFSRLQIKDILASYKEIERGLGIKEGVITLMFRIGKGAPIPHHSFRAEPILEYIG